MTDKNTKGSSPLSARMVEDKATEKLKDRLRDIGLIVNDSSGKPTKPTDKKRGSKK